MNGLVRIRLTQLGKVIIRMSGDIEMRKEDDEGWSEWQLWELFEIFGGHVGFQKEVPFATEIWIPKQTMQRQRQRHRTGCYVTQIAVASGR